MAELEDLETVHIPSNSGGDSQSYHLFEDCLHLRQARNVYEKDVDLLPDAVDLCRRCERRAET